MNKVVHFNANLQKLASSFSCGNNYLDNFLKSSEALDDTIGQTYVLLSNDGKEILGYFNITVGSVDIIDSDLRYRSGGSVHVHAFAIAQAYQGWTEPTLNIHLSDVLLEECFQIARDVQKNVGFAYITLSSTEAGKQFYVRNGFAALDDDMIFSVDKTDFQCTNMYIEIQ